MRYDKQCEAQMGDFKSGLKRRLKTLCKSRRISLSALSEQVSGNQNVLYTCFRKNTIPNIFLLTRIAEALNVSLDYLVGRTDSGDLTYTDNIDLAELQLSLDD